MFEGDRALRVLWSPGALAHSVPACQNARPAPAVTCPLLSLGARHQPLPLHWGSPFSPRPQRKPDHGGPTRPLLPRPPLLVGPHPSPEPLLRPPPRSPCALAKRGWPFRPCSPPSPRGPQVCGLSHASGVSASSQPRACHRLPRPLAGPLLICDRTCWARHSGEGHGWGLSLPAQLREILQVTDPCSRP